MYQPKHKMQKEHRSFNLKFKMPSFRGPIFALIAMAMAVIGLQVATTTSASADTSLNISVSSSATGTPSVSFSNKTLATPGGKTQLLWWVPNHNIKVTMKQVRKAPHIKVYATGANASKVIAKRTHGASVVVLKVGSVVRNTGKLGHIVGGFKWRVPHQAVLKWNKKLKLYQHVYNVIGGKLHKTCGNHIGGPVKKMYAHVVQVRYASSLRYNEKVSATAKAEGYAHVTGSCPDGTTVNVTFSAYGYGSASDSFSFIQKNQGAVTNAKRKSYQNSTSLRNTAAAHAEANARAKVDIKCGSVPPPTPPTKQAPTINLSAGACVNEGEKTGVVNGNVGNPNDESGSGTLTLTPTGATKNITVAANGSGSFSFNGLAAGTYTVSLNMFGKTVSDTATLQQCATPPPPAQENPQVSINAKNDVDINDTASVCANYDVPGSDPATLTFGSTYGSYPGGKTFTVSGSGTKCTTYQAPGEVPKSGTDTLTVSLRDTKTGLSDNTPNDNSTPITINPGGTPN